MPAVVAAYGVGGFAAAFEAGAIIVAEAALTVAVASVAEALLAKEDKPAIEPDLAKEASSRLITSRSTIEPHRIIYGEAPVGGVLLFRQVFGSRGEYLWRVIGLAGHEVAGLADVIVDDELVGIIDPASGAVTTGKFSNSMWIYLHSGSPDQLAPAELIATFPDLWTAEHRLRGLAYITIVTLNAPGVYLSNEPQVLAVVRGKKLYDHRTGLTMWSPNWALIVRDYLAAEYGLRSESDEFDDTDIDAQANLCDEMVPVAPVTRAFVVRKIDPPTVAPIPALSQTPSLLPNTIYQYAITYQDASGETTLGPVSAVFDFRTYGARQTNNPLYNQQSPGVGIPQYITVPGGMIWLTGIPIGPPGTIARRVYRRINTSQSQFGSNIIGPWLRVVTMGDNSSTQFFDGVVSGSGAPPESNTTADAGLRFGEEDTAMESGDQVRLNVTGGTLPGGFTAGAPVYLIRENGRDFKVASTLANSRARVPITPSGSGSGTFTITQLAQPRYTINGTLYLGEDPKGILEQMRIAAMGIIEPVGGQWMLRAAAYATPEITLTADDLSGNIEITPRTARSDLFNQVRGTYVEPTAGWQPIDFPAVKNDLYVTQDNGDEIPKDLDLPYVRNVIRAQRLAKIFLEQARQPISIAWPGKYGALPLTVGDSVRINLPDMGWGAKVFRVVHWSFSLDEAVQLALREDTPETYAWNMGEQATIDPAPDTSLPPANVVAPPTGLIAYSGTEELIHADGTVQSRILLVWTPSTHVYLRNYDLRWHRVEDDLTFQFASIPGSEESYHITGVQDGTTYAIELRAVNILGMVSEWVALDHVVEGKAVAPTDVSGFTAQLNESGTYLSWNELLDADADLYELRLGPSWEDGVMLMRDRRLNYQVGMLAAGTYVFRVKGIDTTGHASITDATVTVTVNLPQTPVVVGTNAGGDYTLTWPAVTTSQPLARYEIRHGSSFAAGAFVAFADTTKFKARVDWSGVRKFWVAALDVGGNLGAAGSFSFDIQPPAAPALALAYLGPDALLTWPAPASGLPIAEYDIRYGSDYASGISLGRVSATRFTTRVNWTGSRTLWIAGIDTAANVGTASSKVVNPTVPLAVSIVPTVSQNLVSLSWSDGTGSLPVERYEIRRGATFAGANSLGFVGGARLKTLIELVGGSYTYWIVGYDSAGNQGTPKSVTLTVQSDPGLTVYEAINSTFAGTLNNATIVDGDVLFPHDTTKTRHQKFLDGGWATVDAKIAAGYDMFAEPSTSSGYYEESIDHGSQLTAVDVTVNPTTQDIDGTPVITCTISYKVNSGDAWTDVSGFTATGVTGRYFKVRIICSSTGGDDLALMDILQWLITKVV